MFKNKILKKTAAVMSVVILLCVNVFCVFAQESVSDYYNSAEEFNFLASDILNSSTALTLKDRASGVTVTFKDKTKLPENLSVSSYRIISGDIYDKIKIRFSSLDQFDVFAVELTDAGEKWEYDGLAVWSVPIPDSFMSPKCAVYYMPDSGNARECVSKQGNGEVSFVSTNAGVYYIYNDNGFHLGDVDNNGKINAADARLVLRYCARLETFSDVQILSSDINSDGKVTAADARLLLRYAAGLAILEYLGG